MIRDLKTKLDYANAEHTQDKLTEQEKADELEMQRKENELVQKQLKELQEERRTETAREIAKARQGIEVNSLETVEQIGKCTEIADKNRKLIDEMLRIAAIANGKSY